MRRALGWLVMTAAVGCGCTSGPNDSRGTHPALTSADSVLVGGNAYGVAISAEGRTYVSLISSNVVVQDDTLPVDGFGSPITVGIVPPHVVFNPAGTRAYVTNQTGQSMSVINVANSVAIATVPLPADGFNLITDASGSQVFVSVSTGQVYVVDAVTNTIVDSIILPPAVNGFARHPKRNRIYISSRDGGLVVEVDATSHGILRTFFTTGRPQRLAVTPGGGELLIANEDLGLDIWNLKSGRRDTTVAMNAYGLGLSPDGKKVYVASGPSGQIIVVDRATRGIDTVLTVGGITRNVAFDKSGETAVITNEGGFVTVVR